MRYHVTHQTTYTYTDGVSISHHAARLKPRGLKLQECEEFTLRCRPRPAVEKTRRDYFGNEIHFFSLQELHAGLDITAKSIVTVYPRQELLLAQSPPWETVAGLFSERVLPADVGPYQFVFDSHLLSASRELAEYARPSFPPERPMAEAAYDLCHRIHRDFKFNPKATTVATPLVDVMKHRHGVCQDFAHIGIACLRSLGLPARYVSGYIRTVPPPGQARLVGADASHAWLSAYCPVLGWLDLDPTNDRIPSEDHITVAFGRDFADVSPVAGVLSGGGEHKVKVAVDVEPVPANSEQDGRRWQVGKGLERIKS